MAGSGTSFAEQFREEGFCLREMGAYTRPSHELFESLPDQIVESISAKLRAQQSRELTHNTPFFTYIRELLMSLLTIHASRDDVGSGHPNPGLAAVPTDERELW